MSYIHVDVSNEFSSLGKVSVTIIWFVSIIWIFRTKYRNIIVSRDVINNNRNDDASSAPASWIALTCAIVMIMVRSLLLYTKNGPYFELKRVIIVEPLLYFSLGSVLSKILVRYYPSTVISTSLMNTTKEAAAETEMIGKKELSNEQQQKQNSSKKLLFSTILSSMVLTNEVSYHFQHPPINQQNNAYVDKTWLWGSTIGSIVAVTGSMSNLLITTLCYDEIPWATFFINLLLPSCGMLFVLKLEQLLCISCCSSFPSSNLLHHDYQLPPDQQQHHDEGGVSSDLELHILSDNCFSDNDDDGNFFSKAKNKYPESSGIKIRETKNEALDSMDTNDKLTINQQTNTVIIVTVLTIIGFIKDCNTSIVLTIATLSLFWMKRIIGDSIPQQSTSSNTASIFISDNMRNDDANFIFQIDYGRIIEYISLFIIMGSLNDTGCPQTLLSFLLHDCMDQITNGNCAYLYALVVLAFGILFSPSLVVLMLASTFPYIAPYGWVLTAFVVSVSDHARWRIQAIANARFSDCCGCEQKQQQQLVILRVLFFAVVSVMVGTFLIASFHTVYECSERLGECA